ncbi:MAG: GTPase RsgA, partial [Acidimicrobiales bacterium]
TLANALLGDDRLATGAVREADRRGRHTTSSRQLVAVPGGGALIDTPGLRSLGLAGEVDLDPAFPDIAELAAGCRFTDCGHQSEPGCAVTAAATAATLDPARLASYRKLGREAAAESRRTDALARKAEARVWKAREKALRQHYRERRR